MAMKKQPDWATLRAEFPRARIIVFSNYARGEEVYQALMSLGMNPLEARAKLDSLLTAGKPFTNLQDALTIIFSKG